MKSKYLNTYSLRCKFKEVHKNLSVEVTIMNHDTEETVQYFLPISFDGKVVKVEDDKEPQTENGATENQDAPKTEEEVSSND